MFGFGDNWIDLEFLQVASLPSHNSSFGEGHVSSENDLRYQEAPHGISTHFMSKARASSPSLVGTAEMSLIVSNH